mmetsp:Transcript_91503/g.218112  ORF Transcript_91503/g.218112 Transcript_91503/m.218112 type:complete len:268 (-) Transcript_91503:433-1236(-)
MKGHTHCVTSPCRELVWVVTCKCATRPAMWVLSPVVSRAVGCSPVGTAVRGNAMQVSASPVRGHAEQGEFIAATLVRQTAIQVRRARILPASGRSSKRARAVKEWRSAFVVPGAVTCHLPQPCVACLLASGSLLKQRLQVRRSSTPLTSSSWLLIIVNTLRCSRTCSRKPFSTELAKELLAAMLRQDVRWPLALSRRCLLATLRDAFWPLSTPACTGASRRRPKPMQLRDGGSCKFLREAHLDLHGHFCRKSPRPIRQLSQLTFCRH